MVGLMAVGSRLDLFTSFLPMILLSASSFSANPPTDRSSFSLPFGRPTADKCGDAPTELDGEGEDEGVGEGLRRGRFKEAVTRVVDGDDVWREIGRLDGDVDVEVDADGLGAAKPNPNPNDECPPNPAAGDRGGVPKERGIGEEAWPKPKARGDGRGAEWNGRVEGGCWVSGCAMIQSGL